MSSDFINTVSELKIVHFSFDQHDVMETEKNGSRKVKRKVVKKIKIQTSSILGVEEGLKARWDQWLYHSTVIARSRCV